MLHSPHVGDDGTVARAAQLSRLTALTMVEFEDWNFQQAGAHALASVLLALPRLQQLLVKVGHPGFKDSDVLQLPQVAHACGLLVM